MCQAQKREADDNRSLSIHVIEWCLGNTKHAEVRVSTVAGLRHPTLLLYSSRTTIQRILYQSSPLNARVLQEDFVIISIDVIQDSA